MSREMDSAAEVERLGALYGSPFRDERPVEQLRQPPCAIESEQSVLGALMIRNDSLPLVADWLRAEDFYRRDHQLIYGAIIESASRDEPFDSVTLGEWFEANGQAELVAGGAYLVELQSTTPSAANIVAYAEIVREKSQLRRLIGLGTDMVNAGFQPDGRRSGEIALAASSEILDMTGGARPRGAKSMRDIAARWFDDLQRRYESGGGMVGLVTPWGGLNRATLGLCPGDLVIVAGRPSMGKSALAVGLTTSAALRGKRVMFFNLEMTDISIFNRCVASVMSIPLKWLRAGGKVEGEDDYWSHVTEGVKRLRDAPVVIDDTPALAVQQIVARAKREHLRQPIDLIIVDHLHLLKLGKGETHRELGDATAALKALGKAIGCPVVLLSQLNRGLESRTNKRPQMQDLRESGAIEQDADVILFLYRDDYYAEREGRESEYPGLVEMFVAKQREGAAGETVWMRDELHIGRLSDYEGEPPKRREVSKPAPRMRNRKVEAAHRADVDG